MLKRTSPTLRSASSIPAQTQPDHEEVAPAAGPRQAPTFALDSLATYPPAEASASSGSGTIPDQVGDQWLQADVTERTRGLAEDRASWQGNVERRKDALRQSRYSFAETPVNADDEMKQFYAKRREENQSVFSIGPATDKRSATLGANLRNVGDILLGNMFRNANAIGFANKGNLDDPHVPDKAIASRATDYDEHVGETYMAEAKTSRYERRLSRDPVNRGFFSPADGPKWRTRPRGSTETAPEGRASLLDGLHTTLNVKYDASVSPRYDPNANDISMMTTGVRNEAAHELQHAHDHLSGNLDLTNKTHTLHSELHAHTQQQAVAAETGESLNWPLPLHANSAKQQAETYVGKVDKGYVGASLNDSAAAVKAYRDEKNERIERERQAQAQRAAAGRERREKARAHDVEA